MPINFPNSPILNEQYTYDNKTWEWNGTYWEVYSALTSYITSAYTVGDGVSDISGVTGGNITLKSFSGVNMTIIDGGDKLTFSGSPQQNVSGLYLPLSGGTVTGGTIFTSGLTANTISSPFTTGSVIFQGSGGTLSQNNSQLFWDNVNNRFGVGTASPISELSVGSINGITLQSGVIMPNLHRDNTDGAFLIRSYNTTTTTYTTNVKVRPNGNFLIGTTTDSGFKLDVNGDARATNLYTGIIYARSSALQYISAGGNSLNQHLFTVTSNQNPTSGDTFIGNFSSTFNPTSGTATYSTLRLVPTINQTGGASGITRGLYVNPALTAAADFRAIETTAGNVLFGTGFTWDNTNGRLGIGTASPAYKVDVQGTTLAASSVRVQGSFDINPLAAPPVIGGFTLSSGTNLGVGQYYYFVVYVTALGETSAGATIPVTTTSGNTTVNLTGIPVSSDSRVTARKLYRTKLGSSSDNQWFLATISNNVTTTYTDSIADASLTGVSLQSYKVNTTARYVTVSGIQGMVIDANLTTLGRSAGNAIITSNGAAIRTVLIGASAGQNITTGQANVIVGVAGGNLTTGGSNTLIGDLAGFALVNGGSNTIMGSQSGRFLISASNNVVLGASAGNRLNDGTTSLTAPTNSIYIGVNARGNSDTETNTIVIGNTALGLGSNTTVIGNNSTTFTSIPSGNLGVGTTTDAGFKLDVNGTARVSGNITTQNILVQTGATYDIGVNATRFRDGWFSRNVQCGSVWTANIAIAATNLTFYNNLVAVLGTLFSTGNLLISTGTQTDAGFKLDVNGTARFKGASNVGTTTALTVINSDSTTLLQVQDNGYIRIGSQAGNAFRVYSTDATGDVEPSGLNLVLNSRVTTTATPSGIGMVTINGPVGTSTTGNQNVFLISKGFSPTSGTGTYAASSITPTINQTGGASGITRGLYINPTLTAAADFRAIEWSHNSQWGLYGQGTANNYLAGSLGIGTTTLLNYSLNVGKNITGFVVSVGVGVTSTILSDVTNTAHNYLSVGSTIASTFTLGTLNHFTASQGTFGLNSIVTNQNGFNVGTSLIGATNNYGFRGQIPSGSNNWNLYMDGSAKNHFNGSVLIGTTTDAGYKLDVNGTARVSGTTTITPATLTGTNATSLLDLSQTWNTTGTPSAIKLNVTNTASNASSNLIDLQVNSVSRFRVRADGSITATGNIVGSQFQSFNGTTSSSLNYFDAPANITATTALSEMFRVRGSFIPTSGTATYVGYNLTTTINQTGGANGITRGLYIAPTLTAAADFRAIETTVGNVILNGTSGNTLIGKTSNSGQKLQVSGNTLLQGSLTATTKTTIGSESDISCALLQMASTTQGVLFPRMTNAQRTSIVSPQPSLMVYCTDSPEGLFIYKSTGWVQII
jgi:hypothetical protein